MLFLVFEMGGHRYAVDAAAVLEVLPLVDLRPVPHAPPEVAGVFDLRGTLVPAIDLTRAVLGEPAAERLSTRLVIVEYADSQGMRRPVALIAERATRTVRRAPADFVASGITSTAAPYLGPVARDSEGLLQRIDPAALLPSHVRDTLFMSAA